MGADESPAPSTKPSLVTAGVDARPAARSNLIKHQATQWLQVTKNTGLLLPEQRSRARSQVECGISIEYLQKFVESVRAFPLIPSTTESIVSNLINAATTERACAMVDLVPHEHVGYATAIVSHAWSGDFFELVAALKEDFDARWEAHKAYLKQRKGTAQLHTEEVAAAAERAKLLEIQQQADAAFHRTGAGWDLPTETPRSPDWGPQPQGHKPSLQPRMSTLGHQSSKDSTSRVNIISTRESGNEGLQGAWQPSAHSPHQRGILRQSMAGNDGVQHQGSLRQRQHRSTAGAAGELPVDISPFADKSAARAVSVNSPRRADLMAAQSDGNNEGLGAGGASKANKVILPSLKGVVKHVMQQQGDDPGSLDKAVRKLKSTANAVSVMTDVTRLLQNAVRQSKSGAPGGGGGQNTSGARSTRDGSGRPTALVHSNTMLHRSGLLAGRTALARNKSLYESATAASSNLLALLRPVDDRANLLEEALAAQRVAYEHEEAARTAKAQSAALQEEKKRLLGYYVWIDIFSLNQFSERPVDLGAMERLVNVVGRTLVIVDEDWRVTERAWCLYEIWLTLRLRRSLITLTTPSALLPPSPKRAPGSKPGSAAGPNTTGGKPSTGAPGQGQSQQPGGSDQSSRGGVASAAGSLFSTGGRHTPGGQSTAGEPEGGQLTLEQLLAAAAPDEALPTLLPLPEYLDLVGARSSLPEDRAAILESWQSEVANSKSDVGSMSAISALLRGGLEAARERERRRPQLVASIWKALGLCSRLWQNSSLAPDWHELDNARVALREVAASHFPAELAKARELQAAEGGDVELELWQLMVFLLQQFSKMRDEPIWQGELKKYAAHAHRSYASRFSNGYVDNLLRAAGTFDDMKVLRSFVASQCRVKITSRRVDDGS